METFITHEPPYYYLCTRNKHNQVWLRLKQPPDGRSLAVDIELLRQEVKRFKDWNPTRGDEVIRVNPHGHFVVPPEAQIVNGRHFSSNAKIKSGPLSRKVTQPWKGRKL